MSTRRRKGARLIRISSVGANPLQDGLDARPPDFPNDATIEPYSTDDESGAVYVRAYTPARGYWVQETPDSWDARHNVVEEPTDVPETQTGNSSSGNNGGNTNTGGTTTGGVIGGGNTNTGGTTTGGGLTTGGQNNTGENPTPATTENSPGGASGLIWLGLLLLLLFATREKEKHR